MQREARPVGTAGRRLNAPRHCATGQRGVALASEVGQCRRASAARSGAKRPRTGLLTKVAPPTSSTLDGSIPKTPRECHTTVTTTATARACFATQAATTASRTASASALVSVRSPRRIVSVIKRLLRPAPNRSGSR